MTIQSWQKIIGDGLKVLKIVLPIQKLTTRVEKGLGVGQSHPKRGKKALKGRRKNEKNNKKNY